MKKTLSAILSVFIIVLSVTLPVKVNAADEKANLTLDAVSCVLMDKSTGEILYADNEHKRLFPASVTKIMPILLVMEALDKGKINLTDTVTASSVAASKGGSQI